MLGSRWGRLVVALLAMVVATSLSAPVQGGATAPAAPATPSADGSGPVADGVVRVSPEPRRSARAVRSYWTPQRMADAVPIGRLLDGGAGTTGSTALEPVRTTAPRRRLRVPRTAGKLFFSTPYGDAVCSAATIDTRRKNQVLTAAHCVHGGRDGGWYRNWVFVPRYHEGRRPYGRWVGKRAYVFTRWVRHTSPGKDQAIIKLRERRGRKLVRVVGGNRMAYSAGIRHRGVRIWGWPAEGRYDGEVAHHCDGRTTRWRGTADAKMRCRMNGGSSGGPWLLRRDRTANEGVIFAVTSRGTRGDWPRYLIARPLPDLMRRMVRAANS